MRLIDADDAVRILACMAEWFPPEDFDRLDFAHDFIESRMTEPVWISVNDRLPEDEEPVLIYTEYEQMFVASRNNNGKWYGDFVIVDNAVYWMPLPEPPELEDAAD